jgi:hypothetical protein
MDVTFIVRATLLLITGGYRAHAIKRDRQNVTM